MSKSKVCTLSEAVSKYIKDGDTFCIGGFTNNRRPYALIHEILRQGIKDLNGWSGPGAGDWDMLIGAGRCKTFINCYIANPGITNVCRRFRAKVERGELLYDDYSQDAMMMMLHAAALGLPFLPVYGMMMGSGMTDCWALDKDSRKDLDKVHDHKLIPMQNPFRPEEQILALPVPRIDSAVIHVQRAGVDGTCSITGPVFGDVDLAIAAKRVIVTCEELVSEEEIRRDPTRNSIFSPCVDAVVHCPYGAFPSQCYDFYDYDIPYYREYDAASRTDEGFDAFLNKYVYGVKDHAEFLDLLGASRLTDLHVTPGYGYRVELS